MGRRSNPELAASWRKRLARHGTSGMSVAAFCSQERVSIAAFYQWRRRLGNHGAPSGGLGGRQTSLGRFLPMPVVATPATPFVEVVLRDGTLVRVPAQQTEALECVLRSSVGLTPGANRGGVDHVEL